MDCNFAIAVLSGVNIISLGIFAGYRITVNKQLIKLEKNKEKDERNIKHLQQKIDELEKKVTIIDKNIEENNQK